MANAMLTKEYMIEKLSELYETTLNLKSKWKDYDVLDYVNNLRLLSKEDVYIRYQNSVALNSKKFERDVQKEIQLMEQSGMLDVMRMSAQHSLD